MKTYTAVCVRSGDWWAIRVPELKGVHSQTKRLAQVEAMARDAVALFLDVDPNSFAVQVQPEVPVEVSEAVQARGAAKAADELAERATRRAALLLLEKGYSVRDVGSLLGLSPQRISQITSTAGKAKPRDPGIAA
jgi:predicted RNase H-like HicB family nuclease